MESDVAVRSSGELRKVLGSRPTKAQENKLDKLISYDSKYNFKVFNLKHAENLLNVDFKSLPPREYVRIFKLFSKNMYYDERIYNSLYRSLYDKIPYFDFDELLKLMEYITPFVEFKGNIGELEAEKVCTQIEDDTSETESSDMVKYDYKRSELEKLQKDIVMEITDIIENRIKFNVNIERDEQFRINSTCLKSLNRLGFLNGWKARMPLSEEVINHLLNETGSGATAESEKLSLKEALESVNNVCDTISQRCIDSMCKKIKSNEYKIKLKSEWDRISFAIVDNVELALSYYSKGDVQILKLIEDCNEASEKCGFFDLKSEEICELSQICNLCRSVSVIYNRLVQCLPVNDIVGDLDCFLGIHYKVLYASKFLKSVDKSLLKNKNHMDDVYTQLRGSALRFFIEHKNGLSPKSQGILVSLICESNGDHVGGFADDKDAVTGPISKHEDDTVGVLRAVHFSLAKSGDLSMIDCLNVLESTYKTFGYVNHYAAKKMADRIFKQYPKNGLEALVILRLVRFATRLPFATVDSESKNVKMALEYVVKPEFRRSSGNSIDTSKLVRNISRSEPKSTKNCICEHDYVLRSSHNITTSMMYTRYCASKGVVNSLKRIRSIAI